MVLARRIINCEIPPGDRLVEDRLSAEFKVSRTPIREAMRLLEQAGHIERLVPRGYAVRALDLATIDQIYSVRIALEELAVTLAAPAIETEAFRRLKDMARQSIEASIVDVEENSLRESFHESLAALSGNAVLARLLQDLDQRIYAVRRLDYQVPEKARAAQVEHFEILQLLESGQIDQARQAMRAHISNSQATIRTLMAAGVTSLSFATSSREASGK